MKKINIAVLPGDGIGPEIVAQAVKAVDAVAKKFGYDVSYNHAIVGAAAIDALLDDQRNVMIGVKNDEIVYVPFSKAIKNEKPINRNLLDTLHRLSI